MDVNSGRSSLIEVSVVSSRPFNAELHFSTDSQILSSCRWVLATSMQSRPLYQQEHRPLLPGRSPQRLLNSNKLTICDSPYILWQECRKDSVQEYVSLELLWQRWWWNWIETQLIWLAICMHWTWINDRCVSNLYHVKWLVQAQYCSTLLEDQFLSA